MDYINQSSYFDSNNLKRFILYRSIRTNKIKSFNASIVNMDVSNADISYAHIKDLDCSNADISYALIHDLDVSSANITNLNVHHDITLNNNPYLPIGIVLPYATNIAPEGWLVCHGQEVSKTTYPSLWNVIGTTFGTSVLPDNFILPDLRGRVIVGSGTGIGLTARSIGDISGAETHILTENEMPSHNHTITDPGHSHTENISSGNLAIENDTPDVFNNQTSSITGNTGTSTTGITINNTGGDQPHNNMQPFLVLNYIIKYRV